MNTIAAQFGRMLLAGVCAALLMTSPCLAAGISESKLIETLASGGEAAENAAGWLGGLESVKGLKSIIAQRDPDLVHAYMRGFPDKYTIPYGKFPYVDDQLNPELEKIVFRHLDDGETGRALTNLLFSRKYRTKALFDAQLKHIAENPKSKVKWEVLRTITHTDLPGIEIILIDLLPKLGAQEQSTLLGSWRDRPFPASALPVLKSVVAGSPMLKGNWHVHQGIARTGSAEAVEYLVSEIEQYRGRPTDREIQSHISVLLNALANVPAATFLPMDRIVANTPHKHDERIAGDYIRLLKVRQAEQGIDDILALVPQPKLTSDALWALHAMDSPQSWPRIRSGLEQLLQQNRIPGGYDERARRLCSQLGNPESYRLEHARHMRHIEYDRRRMELDREYDDALDALEERDPEKHRIVSEHYQKMKSALDQEFESITVIGGAIAPLRVPDQSQPTR